MKNVLQNPSISARALKGVSIKVDCRREEKGHITFVGTWPDPLPVQPHFVTPHEYFSIYCFEESDIPWRVRIILPFNVDSDEYLLKAEGIWEEQAEGEIKITLNWAKTYTFERGSELTEYDDTFDPPAVVWLSFHPYDPD